MHQPFMKLSIMGEAAAPPPPPPSTLDTASRYVSSALEETSRFMKKPNALHGALVGAAFLGGIVLVGKVFSRSK